MFPNYGFSSLSSIPKIGNRISESIFKIINKQKNRINDYYQNNHHLLFIHTAPQYFIRSTDYIPYFWSEIEGEKLSVSIKSYNFTSLDHKKIINSILNSSTFYLWYITLSDCRHLNSREIDNFPIDIHCMDLRVQYSLKELSNKLMKDYKYHTTRKESFYQKTGKVEYDEYYPKFSKSIIDEIDKVLAKHYGFTEEELDFIINYDIKYRMGDELNDSE